MLWCAVVCCGVLWCAVCCQWQLLLLATDDCCTTALQVEEGVVLEGAEEAEGVVEVEEEAMVVGLGIGLVPTSECVHVCSCANSVHSIIHPFIHSFFNPSIHSFISFFIHPSIHSFIHLIFHPSIPSFISFSIHSFIHPFTPRQVLWQPQFFLEDSVSPLSGAQAGRGWRGG